MPSKHTAAPGSGAWPSRSVTGRLGLTGAQRRLRLTTVVAAIFTTQALAALTLPLLAGPQPGAVIGVIAFGIGFGVASLAAPALLADRYGTTGYATIAGTLNAPVALAKATAPVGAAALITATTSYTPVMTAIGAACLIAATGILTRAGTPAAVTDRSP